MAEKHVEVLRELRDTGDVSDWRAMESALDAAILALSSPAPAQVGADIPFATVQKVVRALTKLGVATPCSQEEQAARSVELVNDLCREVVAHFAALAPTPQEQANDRAG